MILNRRGLMFTAGAALCLCLLVASCGGPEEATSVLAFSQSEMTVDASSSKEATLTRTLSLTNNSTRPVTLDRFESSCGCTIPDLPDPAVVPPRGTLDVILKISVPSGGTKAVLLTAVAGDETAEARLSVIGHPTDVPQIYGWGGELVVRRADDGLPERISYAIDAVEEPGTPRWLVALRVDDGPPLPVVGSELLTTGRTNKDLIRYRFELPVARICDADMPRSSFTARPVSAAGREPCEERSAVIVRVTEPFESIPPALIVSPENRHEIRVVLRGSRADFGTVSVRTDVTGIQLGEFQPAAETVDDVIGSVVVLVDDGTKPGSRGALHWTVANGSDERTFETPLFVR